MPFKSAAQMAWAMSPEGMKKLGGSAKVKEWMKGTDHSNLPGHVADLKKPKKRKRAR